MAGYLNRLTALLAVTILAACSTLPKPADNAGANSYFALITNDSDTAIAWYKDVFDADLKVERTTDQFRIVMLEGPDTLIEIIEFEPGAPIPENRSRGLFKSGIVVPDLAGLVTRLRASEIDFMGSGEVFDDPEIGYRSVAVLDPDGNRIQFFEKLNPADPLN